MTMQYAFSFDARFCSGCKACQAACKDKNNLPVGVLWRRVVEVSGGAWQKTGEVWNNTVFAYNLSISCNHCIHPKCAGVCPVDAYVIHENGIVFLDTSKCVGCGYCAWACPYGAPQYNPDAGHMTKCDFCLDHLEQGLPPACVAACPMRVLDCGEAKTERGLALWDIPPEAHPFPLPVYSHTQPRLAIQPHAAMSRTEQKSVANLEEIQPLIPSAWEDIPLILFTLLGQLAVGGFWAMSWIFPPLWALAVHGTPILRLIPSLTIGISLGAGMFASFAHLGTKKNAWRVPGNLRRSWLSREILFAGLFGLGWLITTLEGVFWQRNTLEWMALTSTFGLGLVHSMSQVYRIPAAPGWNTWRTNAGFLVSALLLGVSAMAPLLSYESKMTAIQVPPLFRMVIGGFFLALLFMQLALLRKRSSDCIYQRTRVSFILIGIALTIMGLLPSLHADWQNIPIFMIVAIEEGLGRWLFYRSRM